MDQFILCIIILQKSHIEQELPKTLYEMLSPTETAKKRINFVNITELRQLIKIIKTQNYNVQI